MRNRSVPSLAAVVEERSAPMAGTRPDRACCTGSARSQVTEAGGRGRRVGAAPAEAFDAARFCIDEVKATAPIWKREHWAGGVDWGRDGDAPRRPAG